MRRFLAVEHQLYRGDFWIASIKHQKAKGSKEQVAQTAQQWEQFERSFIFDMTSKTVLEGSSPSTPAKIRANPLGLVLIFVREDSNPERVFAPEKQFCELFLAKRCEDRYQKAKPLGGRADKTPQAAVSFYPCQRRNKFRLFRFFYAKNQSPLHCSSFFPQNR